MNNTVNHDALPSPENPAPKEIERKFIVAGLPDYLDISKYPSQKINQGYLANTGDGSVRVRSKGNAYFLTIKSAPTAADGIVRLEEEIRLSAEQFSAMWPFTAGRRLEKTRFEIPYLDHNIELDIFEGQNQGHIVAEVEFDSIQAAEAFQPPAWFSVDVTADKRFGNASIAEFGFPEI